MLKFIFLAFSTDFLKNFALKTYDTLKMLLLSAENNFMFSVGFQASKIWLSFWKKFYGASLEIIFRQQ